MITLQLHWLAIVFTVLVAAGTGALVLYFLATSLMRFSYQQWLEPHCRLCGGELPLPIRSAMWLVPKGIAGLLCQTCNERCIAAPGELEEVLPELGTRKIEAEIAALARCEVRRDCMLECVTEEHTRLREALAETDAVTQTDARADRYARAYGTLRANAYSTMCSLHAQVQLGLRDLAAGEPVASWEIVCPDGRVRHFCYTSQGDAECDAQRCDERGCDVLYGTLTARSIEVGPPCPGAPHRARRIEGGLWPPQKL